MVSAFTGCGAVWLACWSGGPEVGGSNPLSPTHPIRTGPGSYIAGACSSSDRSRVAARVTASDLADEPDQTLQRSPSQVCASGDHQQPKVPRDLRLSPVAEIDAAVTVWTRPVGIKVRGGQVPVAGIAPRHLPILPRECAKASFEEICGPTDEVIV
jgi:hypothetical protein